ncbi:THUMP-like domain-containing protein, partial [Corynebacterium bovis]
VYRHASLTSPSTLHSGMPETDGEASPVGEVIVDPDGAVVRAGLVRHYAARHGLRQLDPRIAYLTGETVPPGVRGFRVLEQVPLKKLRPALAAAGCGSVEILVRGVDVDPDVLRRKLRLTGDRALSVVVTRIDRSPVAFVCEAVRG